MSTLRWTIVVMAGVFGCYAGPFGCSFSSHRMAARPAADTALHAPRAASDLGPNDHWSHCPICRAAYDRAGAGQGR